MNHKEFVLPLKERRPGDELFEIPLQRARNTLLKKAVDMGLLYEDATLGDMSPEIMARVQEALGEEVTAKAIEMGFLEEGSLPEEVTDEIEGKMIKTYVLRDAIAGGFLPKAATIDDVTSAICTKMLQEHKLKIYDASGKESEQLTGPGGRVH